MNTDIIEKVRTAYEQWLMYEYPEEIGTKDDLLSLSEEGYMFDKFIEQIKEEL